MRTTAITAFVVLAASFAAQGVIIHGEQLERPEQAFVGVFRGGSAVAIGENRFITAAHVGGVTRSVVELNGERYIATSVTPHPELDIAVIEIEGTLPGWYNVTDDIGRGDRVIIGGNGKIQSKKRKKGYKWASSRSEIWGENIVNFMYEGYGFFDFDKKSNRKLDAEAIFSQGDSGGGVFVENPDGTLDLAGIAIGVTGKTGFSRFGNLGVFLPIADALRAFDSSFAADVIEDFEGPLEINATETPTPSSVVLLLGAGAAFSGRRRRS